MKQILLFFSLSLLFVNISQAQGPPPSGITPVYFCDDNSDGFLTFDLDYILNEYFDFGVDTEVTFHLTADDAFNGVNPISGPYFNSINPEYLWVRFFDIPSGTSPVAPGQLELNVIDCTNDQDSDSVVSSTEDLNGDFDLGNDDTDSDGFPNFMDDDDDDDGVLTINEDYNGNGDPTDDDINGNMIPDYLDADATLNISTLTFNELKIYPNPTRGKMHIEFANTISDKLKINVNTVLGTKIPIQNIEYQSKSIFIDLSTIADGLYFLIITDGANSLTKRILLRK